MTARRARWTGHAARMGTMRNAYTISVEISKHLEDFAVNGMIILKTILNKLSI
jgi:hypothetical protein